MLLFYRCGKIFCPEAYYAVNHELLKAGLNLRKAAENASKIRIRILYRLCLSKRLSRMPAENAVIR